ncbi:neurotrypsin-like [Diadema antillarum]|uniref:neurotrypsin-like n=1 Tax=Diadema antillarum TaxID=105358 RepID=UPI003A873DE3
MWKNLIRRSCPLTPIPTPAPWNYTNVIDYVTPHPDPLNFDLLGEIQLLVANLYGVDNIYAVNSVCPAVGGLLSEGRSWEDVVTEFAVELVKILLPVESAVCAQYDEYLVALMQGGYTQQMAVTLFEEVPRLAAIAAGYSSRQDLCVAVQSATTEDLVTSLAEDIVGYVFGVLTDQTRCTEILMGSLNLTALLSKVLSYDDIIADMPSYTGFSSPEELCQYIGTSFGSRADPLQVRLVNGVDESEGRVEIFYNGKWGTVCDDYFGDEDAQVICQMLGYRGPAIAQGSARYGAGSGDIVLDDVMCLGVESNIAQCSHLSYGVNNCGHYEDVGVNCSILQESPVPRFEVRLAGGPDDTRGRVEVYYEGQWGTVCDDSWDIDDSNVVCRMLGFEGALGYSCCAEYGEGSDPILLDDVRCRPFHYEYNQNLGACPHNRIGVHNCGHHEDVGVECIPPDKFMLETRINTL